MFVRHGSISIDGARKVTQNGRVAWAASTSGGTNATGGRDDFEEVSVQERERDQERERERNERKREREKRERGKGWFSFQCRPLIVYSVYDRLFS